MLPTFSGLVYTGFLFNCGVFIFVLCVLEGVGDGRSGTRFSGGGRPAWFSPVFLCHMADKRGVLARGRLCHQFFSFPDPLGGVGGCFLAAVAGLTGISEGNDGGDVSKGLTARGFWPGICGAHLGKGPVQGTCRIILWTFHRLDGWGRGTRPVVRGLRPWLVSRACARAAGMSQGVESPDFSGAVPWVGSRGLPWVFGSSFDDVS